MKINVHCFQLDLSWHLLGLLNQLERFGGSWSHVEKEKKASLKNLKSFATISSVGSSTRIEGSVLNDLEVEGLLKNIDVNKIQDRDSQEVIGYFNCLDLIHDEFENIQINEGDIKNLHKILLRFSDKDQWHLGDYKQQANVIEGLYPDGSKRVIFQTTEPGIKTQDAMRALIHWFQNDQEVHPMIKCGVLVYEFLSIHPFQDGNGRLSRLLTNVILLKSGFTWVQYVSFEHIIEKKKEAYYRHLRNCQMQRPNEDITSWVEFFLSALIETQKSLLKKITSVTNTVVMSPKEKMVADIVDVEKGIKSSALAEKLGIPLPTIKRILSEMVKKGFLVKYGKGPGTHYALQN